MTSTDTERLEWLENGSLSGSEITIPKGEEFRVHIVFPLNGRDEPYKGLRDMIDEAMNNETP